MSEAQDPVEQVRDWLIWFNCVLEPISRDPVPRMIPAFLTPTVMSPAYNRGENAWDYQRKAFPDPPVCACGRACKENRRCWARPTCETCLPPPPLERVDGPPAPRA